MGFFQKLFGAGGGKQPGEEVLSADQSIIEHRGLALAEGKSVRYRHILIVDDHPGYAIDFVKAIQNYYTAGAVTMVIALNFSAATSLFPEYAFDLVLMDKDLRDERGSGVELTRDFRLQRPELVILATSSDEQFNQELIDAGVTAVIGKNPRQLRSWLWTHDKAWK